MGEKVEKWLMANGNYQWVRESTMNNIELVYDELLRRTGDAKFGSVWVTKKELELATGKPRNSIATAVHFLAYHHDPFIRIKANPNMGQVGESVTLLKKM